MSRPVPPASLLTAELITAVADRGQAVILSSTVPLDRPASEVTAARLFATAHGIYQATINDQPVSEAVLAPGWASYEWRLPWQEYDVTHLVSGPGKEVSIQALLGNGWYRGDFGPWADLNYGEQLGLLAALEVDYRDGHRQVASTSTDWSARASDVTENSLYNGQRIDARLRGRGSVLPVESVTFDAGRLVPQAGPPVVRQEVLRPRHIWQSPSGRTLVDFGQNLVGWLRFTVRGAAGTEVVVRHAEALQDGELATAPLRDARATDRFVLSGGADFFEPTLTFHGFRYAEVCGWPGQLTPDSLEAVVVGSALRPTGSFECSDPRVNQLVHNSVWGQKGNFLSIPTDCPQRDERLGWTGDIAVYAPTAAFQFDVADFLDSWLLDLTEEQLHNPRGTGWVPWVVPDLMKYRPDHDAQWNQLAAVWADAVAWVPQALWLAYGDTDRLARHYPAIAAYLQAVEKLLSPSGLWDTGFQFGDWLDPDAPPQDAQGGKADPGVVATACLYRSATFAAEAARVLGHPDQARWAGLAERIREAFNSHYLENGRVRSDCATVYALGLQFELLDQAVRPAAAARLADLVRQAGYRATTGFAGTPYVTWALADNGYVGDAYRLLLVDDCPSWLYQVSMGATTMWERWDSVLPDGTLNDPIMTSLNHYAFGAVCDWLYQGVAGIRPAEPGYRRILIQPTPGTGLEWVKASYRSRVGHIAVEWHVTGDWFELRVELPDGVPTEVVLPDRSRIEVRGGNHDWRVPVKGAQAV